MKLRSQTRTESSAQQKMSSRPLSEKCRDFKANPIREPNNFSSGDDLFVPGECANASMLGMEKRREELLTLEKIIHKIFAK